NIRFSVSLSIYGLPYGIELYAFPHRTAVYPKAYITAGRLPAGPGSRRKRPEPPLEKKRGCPPMRVTRDQTPGKGQSQKSDGPSPHPLTARAFKSGLARMAVMFYLCSHTPGYGATPGATLQSAPAFAGQADVFSFWFLTG